MIGVEARIEHEPNTGCWIWTGDSTASGYGLLTTRDGGKKRRFVVHRLVYEQAHGQIPAGLVLDHKCRLRSCVNPDHLEPVTQRTNVVRGDAPPARNAKMTTCRQGHPFTHQVEGQRSYRRCRTCVNRWALGHRRRRGQVSRDEWRRSLRPLDSKPGGEGANHLGDSRSVGSSTDVAESPSPSSN